MNTPAIPTLRSAASIPRLVGRPWFYDLAGLLLMVLFAGPLHSRAAETSTVSNSAALAPLRVFILAGQSNAEGFCDTRHYREGREPFPDSLKEQRNILYWLGTDSPTGGSNRWTTLRVTELGRFGPEIGFGTESLRMSPTNAGNLALIKYASGGTGIARSQDYTDYIPSLANFNDHGRNWHPSNDGKPAGNLYTSLLVNVRQALDSLDRSGRRWELAGFVWMQGEHEAGISRKMAEDYGRLLTEFIQSVRQDLNAPSLPVVIGEINSHTWAFGEIARNEQREACLRIPGVTLVKTVDLPRINGDAAHFTTDGMLTLGIRFATALQTFNTNQPSWPSSAEQPRTTGK